MKKTGLFILISIISIFLASLYGFIHNQLSYSISAEYFTKFKFEQFWSVKYMLDYPRMSAGLVGIASTWWFGLLAGLAIGIVGFFHSTPKMMWKNSLRALIRCLGITFVVGVIGLIVGYLIITNLNINWNLPAGLIDRQNFLIAGTMHNFSYLGGITGVIYGIVYQLKSKRKVLHLQ